MNCKAISIGLAKNVFQVLGVNERCAPLFNKKFSVRSSSVFMMGFSLTTTYLEACYSSSYWAREFETLSHAVMLISAQHMTPFVRGNKNDANYEVAILKTTAAQCVK